MLKEQSLSFRKIWLKMNEILKRIFALLIKII